MILAVDRLFFVFGLLGVRRQERHPFSPHFSWLDVFQHQPSHTAGLTPVYTTFARQFYDDEELSLGRRLSRRRAACVHMYVSQTYRGAAVASVLNASHRLTSCRMLFSAPLSLAASRIL